jgi:hypothetical protein
MSAVPYTFASNTGNIPLVQLDINFANVKAFADTAGYVTANAQANITSVGTLTALTVSGITTINSATANTVTANTVTANTVTANTVTANSATVNGDIVIFGNATINGTTTTVNSQTLNVADKNITVANNVSTSALINGAGIDAGNPTVAYIRYSDATKGWTTANNFNITGNTTSGNLLTSGSISATGNLTISGTTTLLGNSTATTAANNSNSNRIATTAFVRSIVPTGVITLWYGSIASIPSGWYLCDGTNGTPDLRDRFVVGAGNTYAVAATGGSADAVVVSHAHTATSTVTDPGHVHPINVVQGGLGGQDSPTRAQAGSQNTSSAQTGITVATTISSTGVSGTNANLPPYYALAYIMKA